MKLILYIVCLLQIVGEIVNNSPWQSPWQPGRDGPASLVRRSNQVEDDRLVGRSTYCMSPEVLQDAGAAENDGLLYSNFLNCFRYADP